MKMIEEYIKKNKEDLIQSIINIASIPSPTGSEKEKAEFIMQRLTALGATGHYIDEVGNVIYKHNPHKTKKARLYVAHIDTVFMNIDKIEPVIEDNKLYGPSVADNSANIASLLLLIQMLIYNKIDLSYSAIFAFDVGEEGLGDLRGIKHIMASLGNVLDEVVAVDGDIDKVVNKAVGSKRYKVIIETEGGHSYYAFGKANAIAVASEIINKIYKLDVPKGTTYNAGTIIGGTSINTVAASCEFLLDLRSDDKRNLDDLNSKVKQIIGKNKVIPIGERPSGGFDEPTKLEKQIINIRSGMGLDTTLRSASMDSNIPLSLGIPAIGFGTIKGYKTHSTSEYLELDSIERGFIQLAKLVLAER